MFPPLPPFAFFSFSLRSIIFLSKFENRKEERGNEHDVKNVMNYSSLQYDTYDTILLIIDTNNRPTAIVLSHTYNKSEA